MVANDAPPGWRMKPALDVAAKDGRLVAVSDQPWMSLDGDAEWRRWSFFEIIYRTSLFDDPVRPVLRFETPDGQIDYALPGPVAGAAAWRGAIPANACRMLISPANRQGRFDFRIESIRRVSPLERLGDVWRRRPWKLPSIAVAFVLGYRREAANGIDWAANTVALDNFPNWLRAFERTPESDGLDAPRTAWRDGPRIAVTIEDGPAEAVACTRAAILAQSYDRFVITTSEISGCDYVMSLAAGDEPAPCALAVFVEDIARRGAADLIYADEIVRGTDGPRPALKPDWSPHLQAEGDYVGRCALRATTPLTSGHPTHVRHIRRFLMTRSPAPAPARRPFAPNASAEASVSIIILTKDRPALLEPCLETLLGLSTHRDFEVLIVDNATTDARALAILDRVAGDSRVRVIRWPQPFDFAAINNSAAAQARGEVLIFLNNDTEIVTPDWIERLSALALQADVGAVGCLLLFPDGLVQHAGIVVGLGQEAGHFGSHVAPESASWLDGLQRTREVAAVTAACLAVAREKFQAVGGFDAANLPVEFNDIDLCLRLAERGWGSLFTPDVRLRHKESATRGRATFRPLRKYARERDYFLKRWCAWIRDDPFYHPALSLYARAPALDATPERQP